MLKNIARPIIGYKAAYVLSALLLAGFLYTPTGICAAFDFKNIRSQLGPNDAVMVADSGGNILFAHNPDKALIPASTLKLLTALTAFHYLGIDYRFRTEFYLDEASNLKIKGYGDPLLISEIIDDISSRLVLDLKRLAATVQDIVIDTTFFEHPVIIPGVTDSNEPYDAPNGALCVNFNTVNFKKNGNRFVSAEAQTPLLPMVSGRIQSSGLRQGRIRLSSNRDEIFQYAGRLFQHFFKTHGILVKGRVRTGKVRETDPLITSYRSPFTLEQVVMKMMTYSNNFMANQILLHTGAHLYDPPGTLQKAVDAARSYATKALGFSELRISEGSGISRKNRMTANQMLAVLQKFRPYHHLLTREGKDVFKTGTLMNISTRVGYIQADDRTLYPYAILLNSPGKSAQRLAEELQRLLSSKK
jgi:D-alanyl-D-alanine carboxypeptidase/D-alanyl-D-alanine-endopeptidase (penicillin-binding protein 4)